MNIFQSTPLDRTTRVQTMADPRMAAAQDTVLSRLFGVDGAAGILSTPRAIPLYEQYVQGFDPLQQAAIEQTREQVIGTRDPLTGELVSGGTGIGGYQNFLDQSQANLQGSTATYDPASAAGFRNEFADQVIDRARMDIQDQADRQRRDLAARAVSQGAFGGAREAVERGQINLGEQRAIGDVSARVGAEAERFAQQQAQSAFEAQQRRQAGAAGQFAGLAGQAQSMGMNQLNQLMGAGSMSQAQNQRVLDAQLRGQTEMINQPFQDVQFATGILSGLPSFGTTQLQTKPVEQPNIVSQLAGLGIAGATIADTFGYNPFASTPQTNATTNLGLRNLTPEAAFSGVDSLYDLIDERRNQS